METQVTIVLLDLILSWTTLEYTQLCIWVDTKNSGGCYTDYTHFSFEYELTQFKGFKGIF